VCLQPAKVATGGSKATAAAYLPDARFSDLLSYVTAKRHRIGGAGNAANSKHRALFGASDVGVLRAGSPLLWPVSNGRLALDRVKARDLSGDEYALVFKELYLRAREICQRKVAAGGGGGKASQQLAAGGGGGGGGGGVSDHDEKPLADAFGLRGGGLLYSSSSSSCLAPSQPRAAPMSMMAPPPPAKRLKVDGDGTGGAAPWSTLSSPSTIDIHDKMKRRERAREPRDGNALNFETSFLMNEELLIQDMFNKRKAQTTMKRSASLPSSSSSSSSSLGDKN
jgi:hypothetical protein